MKFKLRKIHLSIETYFCCKFKGQVLQIFEPQLLFSFLSVNVRSSHWVGRAGPLIFSLKNIISFSLSTITFLNENTVHTRAEAVRCLQCISPDQTTPSQIIFISPQPALAVAVLFSPLACLGMGAFSFSRAGAVAMHFVCVCVFIMLCV